MPNSQKGFAHPLLLIVIGVLIGLIVINLSKINNPKEPVQTSEPTQTLAPSPTSQSYFKPAQNGFKTFINPTFHYQIDIPESWFGPFNGYQAVDEGISFSTTSEEGSEGNIDPKAIYLRIDVYENSIQGEYLQMISDMKLGERMENLKINTTKEADTNINGLKTLRISTDGVGTATSTLPAKNFLIIKDEKTFYQLIFYGDFPVLKQNEALINQIAKSFKLLN